MTIFLCSIIVFLLLVVGYLFWTLMKIGSAVFELEEQVEESLDILNSSYERMAEITSMPVFSDDPIVKELLSETTKCKDSLLLIANKVMIFSGENYDGQE